jgi:hypothetical protein
MSEIGGSVVRAKDAEDAKDFDQNGLQGMWLRAGRFDKYEILCDPCVRIRISRKGRRGCKGGMLKKLKL